MENTDYQIKSFTLTVPQAINRPDFFSVWQETNPDMGVLLIGFDSSLPISTHNKILLLIQEMADQYMTSQDLADLLGAWENVLRQFNKKFFELTKEQISWTRKLNLTIALVLPPELHFVNYGHNHLLLIKAKHLVDIIKTMSIDTQIAGSKIFDQIYSGPIEKFTRLALCNQATFDYIATDKIKNILSLLPIQNIGDQINQLTSGAKKNQNIAGVILQITKPEPISNQPVLSSNKPSQNSIDNLLAASQRTSKFLKPQLLPDLNKWLDPLLKLFKFKSKSELKSPQKLGGRRLYSKVKLSKLSLDKISHKTSNLIRKLKHQKQTSKTTFKNLPTNTKYLLKNLKAKLDHLPRSSKYLLSIAVIILSLLAISLISQGLKKHTLVQTEYYDSLTNQIKSYHDEAQAAIIYGDDAKARQLLKESTNLIYNLPKNNDIRQATYEQLSERNKELLAKANHLKTINSPLLLLDLEKLDSQFEPQQLVINNGRLLILANNKLLNIDTSNNAIAEQALSEQGIESAQMIIPLADIILIYTADGKIFRFDPKSNAFAPTDSLLAAAGDNIKRLASYNKRLYALDNNNQIWRLDPQGSNFSPARSWLQQELDTSQAKDLAIDGNIYILTGEGSVTKLTQGRQVEFELENIEPNLTNATRLFTAADIPYIYILDPVNKRLVIYDSQKGKLIKQYQSDKLTELKDFSIDYKAENDKSIVYLLSGHQVYQILIDE